MFYIRAIDDILAIVKIVDLAHGIFANANRNDAYPLEFDVIDNCRAGEIRSTKDLSGGGSFIVSLSRAL